MIGRLGYGMCNADLVSVFSLDTKAAYLPLLSVRTADTWQVQVTMALLYHHVISNLCFTGEDLAINLWDLGSGRRVKKMTGHTASIYSLSFSAESSVLVSGGADWTVRCWDVKGAGGPAGKPRENGNTDFNSIGLVNGDSATGKGYSDEESIETYVNHFRVSLILLISVSISTDLLAAFPTKRTPITNVQFTPRNLCLVAGSYLPPDIR